MLKVKVKVKIKDDSKKDLLKKIVHDAAEKGKKEATDGEGGCGKMMKDGNGGPGDNPMKGAYYKFLKKSRSAARIAKTVGLGL